MLKPDNIVNPTNFIKQCDAVYSKISNPADLSTNLHKYIEIKNIDSYENKSVFYINQEIELADNYWIFAHSETVELLFNELNNIEKFNNLTLVTSQSDRLITKKLFNKKPDCISNWYSTNVVYNHVSLHPIPLGISDSYNLNNFSTNHISNYQQTPFDEKIDKLFINFRKNTNSKEREKLVDSLKHKEFVYHDEYSNDPVSYIDKLSNYKFVLCPWGNGIDTYRLWETLFSGSIPVVKKHDAYKKFKKLPIIFYENNEDLTLDYLVENEKNINLDYSREFLTVDFWINKNIKINENIRNVSFSNKKAIKNFIYKRKLNSKLKILKYYFLRYTNPINYLNFIKKKLDN